jgi:hypothetical protein
MQKWEYCLVVAHLKGSYVDKTVVLEESQTTSSRKPQPAPQTAASKLGLRLQEEPVPELTVLAINGKRPKESLSMHVLANELGEQGWGLVNIEHTTGVGGQIVSVWVF